MKMTRLATFELRYMSWCPKCGAKRKFNPYHTGLPGITCDVCEICQSSFQYNYLEKSSDILEVPDFLVMPPQFDQMQGADL